MARNKASLPEKELQLLQLKLEESFGRKLRKSVDCEHLSERIQKTTGEIISAQTLRRIFGFIKSPFSPSASTLQILSAFCGYRNWDDLLQSNEKQTFLPLSSTDEAGFYLNFFQIEIKSENDINYHNACRNIAYRILQNPGLFHKLAAPLAEQKTSQVFFYERFPYIDGLTSYYRRGIRIYLNNNKHPEAQIFGHALLLLGAVLMLDEEDATDCYHCLNSHSIEKSFHPFIIARFTGCNVLYKIFMRQDASNEMDTLMHYAEVFSSPSKIDFWHFPYYQFMTVSHLNLAGLYHEAAMVIQKIKPGSFDFFNIESGYPEVWEVLQKVATHNTNPAAYIKWFDGFNSWGSINFIFRNYYRMLALSALQQCLSSNDQRKQEVTKELSELAAKTGFKYFEKKTIEDGLVYDTA